MPERRIPTERRDWRQVQERMQRFFAELPAGVLEIGYAIARVPWRKDSNTQTFLNTIGTKYGEEQARAIFQQFDAMRTELHLNVEQFHQAAVAVMEGRKPQAVGGAVKLL